MPQAKLKYVAKLVILFGIYNAEHKMPEDLVQDAETIDTWYNEKDQLMKLDNWLSQEYDHLAQALSYLVYLEEKYQTGIPSGSYILTGSKDLQDTLFGIHEAITQG